MLSDWINIRDLLALALVFMPLERLFPVHRREPVFRQGMVTDLLHYFLSGLLISLGLMAILHVAITIGEQAIPAGVQQWSGRMPLVFAVPAIIIIADLGFYFAHRMLHSVPFLWRFHAVHHSSRQLDWLAAYRVHPIDQVIVKSVSLVPVFVLGFSELAILCAALVYHWHSIFLHSNIRAPFGPLKWIIASPEFHHWHHADAAEAHDRNFAGQVALWDVIFSTAHMPGPMPGQYGINDPVPHRYFAQLAYPFLESDAPTSASRPVDKTTEERSIRT